MNASVSNYRAPWTKGTLVRREHTCERPVMPGNLNAGVGSDPPFAVLALNLGRGVLDVLCGRRFVLTVTGLFDAVCLPPPFFARKRIGSRLKKRHSIARRVSLGSLCAAARCLRSFFVASRRFLEIFYV